MSPSDPWPERYSHLDYYIDIPLIRAICTLCGAIVDIGDALVHDCRIVMKIVVQFAFVDQLRMLCIFGLELDGNVEVGFCVDTLVDFAESSLVEFA